jgi:ATP-dependent Lhr-like helicase
MYDNTVLMLAGLDKKKRLRDIKPRIWFDRATDEIGAADGALSLLYMSGGVIANRGMYSLRLADGTKIGEADEEFVWERRIGDCFDFGARGWRIVNIGDESVGIVPLESRADFIPFWRADTVFRSKNLTGRLADILARYNVSGNIESSLEKDAEDSLKSYLDAQKTAQNGLPLPDKNNVVVEITDGVESNKDFLSVVIHTFLGGAVNYPFAIALSGELEEKLGLHVESFSNDNSVILLLPRNSIEGNVENFIAGALDALASVDRGIGRGERLFRNRLEKSGVFGANFREATERSLLLPKAGFGKRTPLWIMRQRAKRLFDTVADSGEFPVTAEAWRSCLVDIFDMDGFRELLSSIGGSVKLSFFHSARPSPFSEGLVRQEVNSLIYEYDERKDLAGPSTLSDRAIEEALGNAALRPVLKKEIVRGFVSRLRREAPGWAPEDASGLNEWVKERIAIPIDEWETLCHALPEGLKLLALTDKNSASALSPLKLTICESTSAASAQSVTRQFLRLMVIKRDGACVASVVHSEWEESWKNEALSLLGPWLRYEGPVSIRRICEVFGVSTAIAEDAVNALVEVDEVVRDVAVEADYEEFNPPYGAGELISRETTADKENNTAGQALDMPPAAIFICDRENLNMLLRVSRKKFRLVIKERPASLLPAFLAMRQGIAGNAGPVFKRLGGWTAPVKLWETEILCARNIYAEDFDGEIQKGKLLWYGAGKERAGFCLPEDFELVSNGVLPEQTGIFTLIASGFFDRHRDFWEIKNELERVEPCGMKDCAKALWDAVWKGLLSADSFEPVRRGIESGFALEDDNYAQIPSGENYALPFGRAPKIPRALRDRWRYGAPVHGAWFSLLEQESGISELEEETLNRDRVRLLIKRWGILCRPLFAYEVPPFSWSYLLPTIRRMELSGELIAGRFFSDINSLQFASPAIAHELEAAESIGGIYWMNATDPASPAGIEIEGISQKPCHRIAANRLYYKGAVLAALSGKNNREITIFPDLCENDLHELITLVKITRTRKILPEKNVLVEKINGQPAAASDYAAFFIQEGFVSDRGRLIFW